MTVFNSLNEEIENGNITKYKIKHDGQLITFHQAITFFQISIEFRQFFNELLAQSKYGAYFWEVKPVTRNKLNEVFEFVLINGSIMTRLTADRSAFSNYFNDEQLVVSFPNIRGDAKLIVPTEASDQSNYCHLANFARRAPKKQIDEFWKIVGEQYAKSIKDKPKWLSTAGLGVYWVHARIDTEPKYYKYKPYKEWLS